MQLRKIIAALLLSALPFATPARAQDLASLVADRIAVSGDNVLVAEGGVIVRYRGQTLRANRVSYDRTTERLDIIGPITVTDARGNILMADAADLSADLQQGVLNSARMVMQEKMQIAARQILRAGGRYTQLTDAVASSCQVCAANPRPLWEIRAARVVHDELEQQLYFDRAQLRFAGVPVFFLPRLRMPDPTLARATGFLMPQFRTTSGLGSGIKQPYFITLGPSRDLTLTPYLSTKSGRTLEARYREAFPTGEIEMTGSLSRDDIRPGENRGYLAAEGRFDLPKDFTLRFSGMAVSDPAYLLDYGISDEDRIESRVEISRTRRNEYISGRLIQVRSIRDTGDAIESNSTLATLIGDLTWHRRFSGGPLGGEAGLRLQAHGHYRSSSLDTDTAVDEDLIADGRDVARLSLRGDWRRNWIFGPGLIGAALGEVSGDFYQVRQDATLPSTISRLHGAAAVELRWPWVGSTADGAGHVIEPVVQLVLASRDKTQTPAEDSVLVEFDEGNLFSLGRFSGADAREQGNRMNVGLSYTRFAPEGWSLSVAAGRIYRQADEGQFTAASGLEGINSDWLTAAQLTFPGGLALTNRLLFGSDFGLTKAELRMDLAQDRYGLSSSYIWLQADTAENRPDDTQELYFDGRYMLSDTWIGKMQGRYDFESGRATRAGLGLEFRNECLRVDLSLSRRFTSSTSVKPTTDFGLSVDLLGFGGSAKPGPAQKCRG